MAGKRKIYTGRTESGDRFVASRQPDPINRQLTSLALATVAPGTLEVAEDGKLPNEYANGWVATRVAPDVSNEYLIAAAGVAGTVEVLDHPVPYSEIDKWLGDQASSRLFGFNSDAGEIVTELP